MIKIFFLFFILGIICYYIKETYNSFYPIILFVSGLILFSQSISYLDKTFDFFKTIKELSGIDEELFKIIVKLSAISILIQFCSDLLTDIGEQSLANKSILLGKIILFSTSLPVFYSLLNLIKNILEL